MKPIEAVAFVERHGVVLQSARGPVPNLAEAVARGPLRGSWWSHRKGKEIFHAAEAVSESPDVLVCKLIEGKVTFVHRRLWPALVKLAGRFRRKQLTKVWNEHTSSGAHRLRQVTFPSWVPAEVMREAAGLSISAAESILSQWPARRQTHCGERAVEQSVTGGRAPRGRVVARNRCERPRRAFARAALAAERGVRPTRHLARGNRNAG